MFRNALRRRWSPTSVFFSFLGIRSKKNRILFVGRTERVVDVPRTEFVNAALPRFLSDSPRVRRECGSIDHGERRGERSWFLIRNPINNALPVRTCESIGTNSCGQSCGRPPSGSRVKTRTIAPAWPPNRVADARSSSCLKKWSCRNSVSTKFTACRIGALPSLRYPFLSGIRNSPQPIFVAQNFF